MKKDIVCRRWQDRRTRKRLVEETPVIMHQRELICSEQL